MENLEDVLLLNKKRRLSHVLRDILWIKPAESKLYQDCRRSICVIDR
jgi:hypothetical protein